MVGDYAAWDYFQSLDNPENREFIRKFKANYGSDRVTSDVITAAYNSVGLWAQAVAEAESDEVADVLKAIRRQSMNAPEGVISIDESTLHTWRPVYIGRIRADGQFDVVWSSEKAVRPIPFPVSRPRVSWESFLNGLFQSWGGWANPGSGSGTRPAPGGGRSGTDRPAGSSAILGRLTDALHTMTACSLYEPEAPASGFQRDPQLTRWRFELV